MRQRTGKRWGLGILAAILMAATVCVPVLAATKTQLGEPEEVYWDGNHPGVARWKKVDKAKEYEVRLYEGDDERVARVTVSATKADFSRYMTDGRWYHFSVRAVPKSNQKNLSAGEWVDSEMMEATGFGDNSGKWRTYSEGKKYQKKDESYATGWYKIQGKWYLFDKDGFMLTGWQQVDNVWYYLDAEGVMQTGWLDLDGSRYYLTAGNGSMAVGWIEDKPGEWYYMGADGRMLTDTVVEGYQLDSTGKRVS